MVKTSPPHTIKVVVWTAVGRTELLEALAPLTNVAVEVAHNPAEFLTALSDAQILVMTGTSDTYSAEVAARVRGAPMLRWIWEAGRIECESGELRRLNPYKKELLHLSQCGLPAAVPSFVDVFRGFRRCQRSQRRW